MSKAEWGLKRVCASCGTRYYDMKKNPPLCPHCKTAFDPENLMRTRRARKEDKKAAVKEPEEVIELPAADAEAAPAEDAVIEDAEELGDEEVEVAVEEREG